MQAPQLCYKEEQAEQSGADWNEQTLQVLPETYAAQRNKVMGVQSAMADMEKNAEQTAAEKKAKKAAAKTDSKQSGSKEKKEKKKLFARIAGWFKDLKKEFKRVVWPDRKKVLNNTLVVLCVVIVGSVLVGLIDTGLLRLMQYLMGLSN